MDFLIRLRLSSICRFYLIVILATGAVRLGNTMGATACWVHRVTVVFTREVRARKERANACVTQSKS